MRVGAGVTFGLLHGALTSNLRMRAIIGLEDLSGTDPIRAPRVLTDRAIRVGMTPTRRMELEIDEVGRAA
ncbi:hypothetical protein GCM10009851_23420 [Herbiconiux moechotypicola]|uniref:Uncharacterized protein n=1 Tax=Herbiconiux moechotypicola TaxID=637393 RepID=A0ABP5QJA4_9MICO